MQRKQKRRLLLGLAGLVILGICAAFLFPLAPHGRFRAPEIGSDADAYFELADGKFSLVVWTGESGRSGEEERDLIGDYRKEQGRWILIDRRSGHISQLHTTPFSLEIIETNGARSGHWSRMWR